VSLVAPSAKQLKDPSDLFQVVLRKPTNETLVAHIATMVFLSSWRIVFEEIGHALGPIPGGRPLVNLTTHPVRSFDLLGNPFRSWRPEHVS